MSSVPQPPDRPDQTCRPPHLTIELALEERPRVRLVADHEGDELRLRIWLQSQPALRDLVDAALELVAQESAA